MTKSMIIKQILTGLIAPVFLIILSCTPQESESSSPEDVSPSGIQAEEPSEELSASAVDVDLSVPPPGSPATQEKWDTFTEDKKQSSWDKYLEGEVSDSSGQSEPVEEAVEPGTPEVPTGNSGKSLSVIAAPLSRAPMDIYYYGLGEIEAGEVYRVSPAVSGTAARLYVREGDYVEPGELLFALDSSEWLNDIERAEEKWETEITLASVKLEESAQTLQSMEAFYERDLVTKQEVDRASQSYTESRLNMEKIQLSRETELENLQKNYQSRLGVSSGRGYVSVVSFSEGEQINTGDFVEIMNLEEVELIADVPENIVARVSRGAKVLAKTASSPAFNLEGEVTGRGIVPDDNRSYLVRAVLDNPNQRLFPGMLMEVRIQVSQIQPRFVVPRKSVITEGPDSFLFIIKDGLANKVPVKTGAGREGLVQVDGDLSAGDLIAIEGQSYIKDGSAVSVVDTRNYLPETIEF